MCYGSGRSHRWTFPSPSSSAGPGWRFRRYLGTPFSFRDGQVEAVVRPHGIWRIGLDPTRRVRCPIYKEHVAMRFELEIVPDVAKHRLTQGIFTVPEVEIWIHVASEDFADSSHLLFL